MKRFTWVYTRTSSARHKLLFNWRPPLERVAVAAIELRYVARSVWSYRLHMRPAGKSMIMGEFPTLRKAKRMAEVLAPIYASME